jgi:hypothetical protein
VAHFDRIKRPQINAALDLDGTDGAVSSLQSDEHALKMTDGTNKQHQSARG